MIENVLRIQMKIIKVKLIDMAFHHSSSQGLMKCLAFTYDLQKSNTSRYKIIKGGKKFLKILFVYLIAMTSSSRLNLSVILLRLEIC